MSDDAHDFMALGRTFTDAFLNDEMHLIWDRATDGMRRLFVAVSNMSAFRSQIFEETGSPGSILSETIEEYAEGAVFMRRTEWSNAPLPIDISVMFDHDASIVGFRVAPQAIAAPSPHMDYQTKAALRLPVVGAWDVVWGGRDIENNYHAFHRSQRFAVDLLILKNGVSHSGDPTALENFYCWGAPIVSPGEGVVVTAVDGLPDQEIGDSDPHNAAGNYVVIDFGAGEYGVFAHLQNGTVRVAKGDCVGSGDEIGLCGNSGNTTEPHLHFHFQTTATFGSGDGLPAQFLAYRADGVFVERGEPLKGQVIEHAGSR